MEAQKRAGIKSLHIKHCITFVCSVDKKMGDKSVPDRKQV